MISLCAGLDVAMAVAAIHVNSVRSGWCTHSRADMQYRSAHEKGKEIQTFRRKDAKTQSLKGMQGGHCHVLQALYRIWQYQADMPAASIVFFAPSRLCVNSFDFRFFNRLLSIIEFIKTQF
jgi:hypothetical protein